MALPIMVRCDINLTPPDGEFTIRQMEFGLKPESIGGRNQNTAESGGPLAVIKT
jgi:hypothetical protein